MMSVRMIPFYGAARTGYMRSLVCAGSTLAGPRNKRGGLRRWSEQAASEAPAQRFNVPQQPLDVQRGAHWVGTHYIWHAAAIRCPSVEWPSGLL